MRIKNIATHALLAGCPYLQGRWRRYYRASTRNRLKPYHNVNAVGTYEYILNYINVTYILFLFFLYFVYTCFVNRTGSWLLTIIISRVHLGTLKAEYPVTDICVGYCAVWECCALVRACNCFSILYNTNTNTLLCTYYIVVVSLRPESGSDRS